MEYYQKRRDRLRRAIKRAGVDALLVGNFANVTYLTGFTGDDSYLLVRADGEVLLSDGRYTTQLNEECPGLDVDIRSTGVKMLDAAVKVLQKSKIGTLGIEADTMVVGVRDRLADKLPKIRLKNTSALVEQLRTCKDRQEVDRIRIAAECAEKAFAAVRAALTPDQTEKDIADDLDHLMRRFGASSASFPPIVAVGPRSALPHAPVSGRTIGEDGFVLIDWGARCGLYVSDLTRVLITGKVSSRLRRVYEVVLEAQTKAIAAIRPGAVTKDVDAVARGVIADAGFGRHFGHGLGHGIGLNVHEAPIMSARTESVLKAGMVVTVEPGIYLAGWGGVRIEDDVLVTRNGGEVLTSTGKQLEEVVLS